MEPQPVLSLNFSSLGTGFGALILVLAVLCGWSWATLAALLVGVSGWLALHGYCELIYWLAATTSDEQTCLGNAVWDAVENSGGHQNLFMISFTTVMAVGMGNYWAQNALRNVAEGEHHLPA